MSQTPQMPQITGNMLFYQRPELLNKEVHGGLGMVSAGKPFGFCAKARAVPINITEAALAMKHFPVVFTHRENPVMVAVLGVVDELNLFVDDRGMWEPYTYITAYVRRYPFAVANENGGDRFAVVIDAAHEGFVRGAGEVPLFANDQPSEGTARAIDFCKQYETERVMTQKAMDMLQTFDLLAPQQANYTPTGATEPAVFAEYWGIDQDRLQKLTDDQVSALWKNGLLPIILAHIWSFSNWRELLNRRTSLTQADVLKPLKLN